MADVTVKYKGNTITEMSAESTKTLQTSGKYCEDNIEINYVPPVATGSNDVVGTLDGSNVLLEGTLADGTYAFKYKKNDGTYIDIGNLVLDNKVYYSATSNLTNCTNSNGTTTVIGGTSYSATITAESGYDISSIVVTMGGVDITSSAVSGGNITIANITGNIVITAIAKVKPTYTNLAVPNDTNTTWDGNWVNNARMGSDGTYRSSTTSMVTNTVAVNKGDVLYFSGTGFTATGSGAASGREMGFFKESGATTPWFGGTPTAISASYDITFTYHDDGTLASMAYNVNDANTAYMRLVLSNTIDKSQVIITKNEPIS